MGKKTRKTKKAELQLEPDGYSIHTLELSQQVSKQKRNWMKEKLYKKQQKEGAVYIYQNRERAGQYICIQYAYAGIRALLEKFSVGEGAERFFARMVINPRKLIYPQSGYLGILPNEEESVELLGKAFHEVMKNSPFDSKISHYYLSRVDLCTNVRCDNKKVFRELVRLLRKTATSKKYRRVLYEDKDTKKANQYNKHFVRLACRQQELVLYDKTYQMTANGLELDYAKLPDGVLRVEVHYGREKLRSIEKQEKMDDPLELLWLLMQESKERILGLVGKCYPELPYLSFEKGKTAVQESHYKDDTKKRMMLLLEEMRRKQTLDKAFETMEKQGVKKDDLLRKFKKLGFNPIPLRVGYAAKKMPSLLHILRAVEEEPVTIELEYWKWK